MLGVEDIGHKLAEFLQQYMGSTQVDVSVAQAWLAMGRPLVARTMVSRALRHMHVAHLTQHHCSDAAHTLCTGAMYVCPVGALCTRCMSYAC